MLRCALLVALLGAASAANPQARLERTSIETATNKLLRGSVSAEAAARIENVLNSLGSSNITEPTQQYKPGPPRPGPPGPGPSHATGALACYLAPAKRYLRGEAHFTPQASAAIEAAHQPAWKPNQLSFRSHAF